jgi:arylsulfatase A-like enzyme
VIALALPWGVFGEKARPNILFILVDDLSWSDVGFNGGKVYETPNVDRLAAQGIVLTDFYSAGPVCSPTRASILTGKYPARLGLTKWLYTPEKDPPHVIHHLPLEEFTLAEALQEEGYATGYFGKWHLGYKREHWASEQGFDVTRGGIDSPHAWKLAWPDREVPPTAEKSHTRFFSPYHMTHLENGPDGEYFTERITSETMAFIEEHREGPFFAYLSFHTVHTPLQPKPEKIAKYKKKIAEFGLDGKKERDNREKAFQNNAAYAGMVEHMDENVGRLMNCLDELKVSENTIVVWTSDNGGKGSVTSNLPLRGMKHNLYEGGIRVPTIVRWPGHIEAGGHNPTPLISNDFYPTLLALTGTRPRPDQHVDGVSFAGLLLDESESAERDALYWHYPHTRHEGAIREGRYKLLHRFKNNIVELYDLENDIGERTNLVLEEPDLVARLLGKLKDWQTAVGARFEP